VSAGHPGVLLAALADAIAYREAEGARYCADCTLHPAGLCDDHERDLARAADYRALARDLEAGR
jgi:hypothetical protein